MDIDARRVATRYRASTRNDRGIEYTDGPRITAADIERIVGRTRAVVPGSCRLRPTPASERTNEIRFSVITRRISWLIGVARLHVTSTSESGRAYVEVEIQREEVPVPFEEGDDNGEDDDAIPFS